MNQDYRFRRGEISAYGRAAQSARQLWILLVVVNSVVLGCAALSSYFFATPEAVLPIALITVFALFGSTLVWWFAKRNFIEPDLAFRQWLQQVCDGELEARIELPVTHRHHKELHFHTRNLASALNSLSTEMESLVASQTRRLAQQNQSLDLLFHLTADVSHESDIQRVLDTTCRHLAQWFGHATVSAWLPREGKLCQVALQCIESADDPQPSEYSQCEVPCEVSELTLNLATGPTGVGRISQPFQLGGARLFGLVVIDTIKIEQLQQMASHRVLTTIAEQLSLFVAHQSAVEDSREAQMIRDRAAIAADVHDSLAQTLAALRYQVTLLRDSYHATGGGDLDDDFNRIQATVGEANNEVRSLISEYRKPLRERHSTESIRTTVEAFRRSSGLQVFFQTDDPQISFTAREELQLQKIIGEALTNAFKYAQASMIRVYINCTTDGLRRILIEDDGVGFSLVHSPNNNTAILPTGVEVPDVGGRKPADAGNHIGLAIMHDRAATIGAILEMETELGEGTRISINLPPPSKFTGDDL